MKRKRLIGLLLTVALLCVSMVVQVVSAISEEDLLKPFDLVTVNLNDYYLKTVKGYVDGELRTSTTFDYQFPYDDTIDVEANINGNISRSTIHKEYDDNNRLIRYTSTPAGEDQTSSEDFSFAYFDNSSYIISGSLGSGATPSYTYDPETKTFLANGWDITYKDGRKVKMTSTKGSTTTEVFLNYREVTDDDGYFDLLNDYSEIKEYTVKQNGNVIDSGTVKIRNSLSGSVHHETITQDNGSTKTIDNHYDSKGRLTKTVVESGSSSEEITYTYNGFGNLISYKDKVNIADAYKFELLYKFTYEYHPHDYKPAVVSENIVAEEEYPATQESLNGGDDINISMTDPDPATIKSSGVQTYEDGTQYYFNEITQPLDASEEQVFAMNITGSDAVGIDEEDPAPAHSFNIYDSNTFSEDHLVASIENGKMVEANGKAITETEVESGNAGGSGTLMMALPLQVKSDVTTGYNVSVTVPANTLENGKTYYFVLSRDMVTNEEDARTMNTDFVFKFNTAKPHVHTEKTVPAKEATCTEPGLTEGKECAECGEVLVAQEEIPALGHDFKDGVCIRCGAKDPDYEPDVNNDLDPSVNGIVQCPDGRWAMYKNGKVDTTCTTIAQNKYGWWRVKDGYVDFDAQGVYQNKNGWWKTTNGKVTFKEFGLFENENGTWRVEFSKVNFQANGIYQGKDGWYKTTNGKVTFKENGVFQNQFGWWYVKDSKVDFDFNGIASNQFGKWYIKNGKVDFTKVGTAKFDGKTYLIAFGKVLFG